MMILAKSQSDVPKNQSGLFSVFDTPSGGLPVPTGETVQARCVFDMAGDAWCILELVNAEYYVVCGECS